MSYMTTSVTLEAWLAGRIPGDWFTGPATVTSDKDEIIIVGDLATPTLPDLAGKDDEAVASARAAAAAGRVRQFREDTRARRIEIARELEASTSRKVSWGVRVDGAETMFTHLSAPVMSRLRMPERHVLDTLIEAGVAKSRSDAVAWCVRLVGERSETWLSDLRTALQHVEEVRRQGPEA